MTSTNQSIPGFLIDITHALGDIVERYGDPIERRAPPDWKRVRTHVLSFLLPKGISAFQLIVTVEHRMAYRQGQLRELPSIRTQGTHSPDVTIILFISAEKGCRLQTSRSDQISRYLNERLPMVYCRVYPVNPQTRRVDTAFECTRDYVSSTEEELSGNYFRRLVSTIRILSLLPEPDRRPAPTLPPSFVQAIGLQLTQEDDNVISCAHQLMNCSLVCKGWYQSGVYDLLWNCYYPWTSNGHDYARVLALVECLERYSSLAHKIHILPRHWKRDAPGKQWMSLYQRMLGLTASWTNLDLWRYEFHAFQDRLVHLQSVSHLQVHGSRWPHYGTLFDRQLELSSVLNTIRQWKALKQLCIQGWASEALQKLTDQTTCYNLDELSLYGVDEGIRLSLKTVQHILSTPQSLKKLTIGKVVGLTQADFRTILWIVRSTIESLSIHDCIFVTTHADDQKELAFDVMIADMPCLRWARIQHQLMSSHSFSRKLVINGTLSGTFYANWKPRPNDSIQNLEAAFRITGWKVIKIVAYGNEGVDFGHAIKIARRRGITLHPRV